MTTTQYVFLWSLVTGFACGLSDLSWHGNGIAGFFGGMALVWLSAGGAYLWVKYGRDDNDGGKQ